VFNVDNEISQECGGCEKVVPIVLATLAGQALACIEEPVVIEKILTHWQEKEAAGRPDLRPASRAPPPAAVTGL